MGGGRGRNRTQRKHFRHSRDNVWKQGKSDDNPGGWEPFATQNPAFDEYYKGQAVVPPEEWDDFMGFLRKPLPAAFRINSSAQFCLDIKSQLENDFMNSLQAEVVEGGGEMEAIRPLPWYPENLAWQSNFSRMQLRKNQTLVRFHDFLKLENEIGNITRQEAVSMVPPLFLDVHPNHFVLDMCAAPGSKTFQLLEIIHQSISPGSLPVGLVVANDVDVQRCNLLIHQTKRMSTANLIVTNNEAQHFPGCRSKRVCSSASEMGREKEKSMSQLLFDRVLCDVPCSGDGTLRKAPDIWRKWSVGMGNGVHCLQVQIAMRGAYLLKVGGRLVYSTCSMNPVEDEAVVAEILRKCGGSLELVDVSGELPQLLRRPGLKKWKVRDKDRWLSSYKDVPKFRRADILPSMFPSGRAHVDSTNCAENNGIGESHDDAVQAVQDSSTSEVSCFPLERCIRIMPHDQNSGAFFIAVFHKLSPLPAMPKQHIGKGRDLFYGNGSPCEDFEDAIKPEANGDDGTEKPFEMAEEASEPGDDASEETLDPDIAGRKRKLQMQGRWKGVDPVVFFTDEAVINSIRAFYGIEESFGLGGCLVTRNTNVSQVKRIYYISKSAKEVLDLNFSVNQQLKITSVGLKMFERQTPKEIVSASCIFRISSEGLPLLLPHITKQILFAPLADLKHLLQYKSVKFGDFVDAEFGKKASELTMGCCVVVLSEGGRPLLVPVMVDASTIAIGCWKGRGSLSIMVTGLDCQELLERLLGRMGTEGGCLEQEPGMEAHDVGDFDEGEVN